MIGSLHMTSKMSAVRLSTSTCCARFWFILAALLAVTSASVKGKPSFTIDYDGNTFLKDRKPFHYIAGSIHYSRVPQFYWKDRLTKMYAGGLDAIQVYIPWNVHEPKPGVYDFEGQQDLVGFLKMAQEIGLLAVLRAGPYICGEWEYGGFPAWILKENGSVVVRTMDPGYIEPVDRWLSVLLPKIKPLIYSEGGPVIMVQVENEYGSYFACDKNYTAHLRDVFKRHLGDDVVLFTTDGSGLNFLKCGAIDGVYATVDFGPGGNVTNNFAPMRQHNPKGPLVNSEFYTGWLDHWGGPHAHTPTSSIVDSMKDMLDMKASVNMYMYEGGTNFAYMNGADPAFVICPTSYDYDAPLSEAGDPGDKYMAIRELISKYKTLPPIPVPKPVPKFAYGKVQMKLEATVLEALNLITSGLPTTAQYPLSMEQVDQNYGFIMYRHVLKKTYPGSQLSVEGIRDRGHVLLDGVSQGLLDRNGATVFNMLGRQGQTLDLIVENQGRINFGSQINGNRKGLISNVTYGGQNLTNWTIYSLDFTRIANSRKTDEKLYFRRSAMQLSNRGSNEHSRTDLDFKETLRDAPELTPAIYKGHFVVPAELGSPQDTFLLMDGWFKGQAFVNGANLGRYWPVMGPQVTLYVPASVLKPHPEANLLTMVELDYAPCGQSSALQESCVVEFIDHPIINGTTAFKKWQGVLAIMSQDGWSHISLR